MKGEQQWAFTFIKEGILLAILYIALTANTFIKEDIPLAILYIALMASTFTKEDIPLETLCIALTANTFTKEDILLAILYIVLESKNVYFMIDIFYYLLSSLLLYKYIDERLSIAIN